MFVIGLREAQGLPVRHPDAPNLTIHVAERPHAEWLCDVLNGHLAWAKANGRPWQASPTQEASERFFAIDPATGQRVAEPEAVDVAHS